MIVTTVAEKIHKNIEKFFFVLQVQEVYHLTWGKKKLTVNVGSSVYDVDYGWFLDQMTQKIAENIKVPNFVDLMKSDYSTSTGTHVIVSEITIMASVQEFFEYEIGMSSCGIPWIIETEGTGEDCTRIKEKLLQL